jgi:hypothetical protein
MSRAGVKCKGLDRFKRDLNAESSNSSEPKAQILDYRINS